MLFLTLTYSVSFPVHDSIASCCSTPVQVIVIVSSGWILDVISDVTSHLNVLDIVAPVATLVGADKAATKEFCVLNTVLLFTPVS